MLSTSVLASSALSLLKGKSHILSQLVLYSQQALSWDLKHHANQPLYERLSVWLIFPIFAWSPSRSQLRE